MSNETLPADTTVAGPAADILTALRTNYFTAVIGESESAHIASVFRHVNRTVNSGDTVGQAGKLWVCVEIRPGISPTDNLVTSLSRPGVLLKKGEMPPGFKRTVAEILRSGPTGLVRLQSHLSDKYDVSFNLLVLVHRFDDLFEFISGDESLNEERLRFVLLLLLSGLRENVPVYVGIALHPEHISDTFKYRGLGKAVREKGYFLQKLTLSDYLQKAEQEFAEEPVLAERVKADLRKAFSRDNAPDATESPDYKWSFLLTALRKDNPQAASRTERYAALNGLNGVIDTQAQKFYESFDEAERRLIELTFKAICQISESKITAKPMTFAGLLLILGIADTPTTVQLLARILQKYQAADFIEIIEPAAQVKGLFPHPHKTLILPRSPVFLNSWQKAVNWVKKESSDALDYQRIAWQAVSALTSEKTENNMQHGEQSVLSPSDIKNGERLFVEQKVNRHWADQYYPNRPTDEETAKKCPDTFKAAKQFWQKSQQKRAYEKNVQLSKERHSRAVMKRAAVFAGALALTALISFFWVLRSEKILIRDRRMLNKQIYLSNLTDARIIDTDFVQRSNIVRNKELKTLDDVTRYLLQNNRVNLFDVYDESNLNSALLSLNSLYTLAAEDHTDNTALRDEVKKKTRNLLNLVGASNNNNYYYPMKIYRDFLYDQLQQSHNSMTLPAGGRAMVSVPNVPQQFIYADKFNSLHIVNQTDEGNFDSKDFVAADVGEDVYAPALSPDGNSIYAGTLNGNIYRLNRVNVILGDAEKTKVASLPGKIYHLEITDNKDNFYAVTKDRIYWGNGKYLKFKRTELAEINNMSLTPDLRYVIVGGSGKTLFYPVRADGRGLGNPVVLRHPAHVNNVTDINADGQVILGTDRGKIFLFNSEDLQDGRTEADLADIFTDTLSVRTGPFSAITFLHRSSQKLLAGATEYGHIYLWEYDDLKLNKIHLELYSEGGLVRDLIFNNPDVLISMEGNKIKSRETGTQVLVRETKILLEKFGE